VTQFIIQSYFFNEVVSFYCHHTRKKLHKHKQCRVIYEAFAEKIFTITTLSFSREELCEFFESYYPVQAVVAKSILKEVFI
jgi:hypothetical protein